MKEAKATPWILGAAFLAVVILVGMWFLAIAPQLEAASEHREQAQAQRDNNDLLELQNAQLAKQFAELPAMRTELAQYRVGIPGTVDQAAFNREIGDLARATDAFVLSTEFAPSNLISAETAGVGVDVPAGMYAMPVTVTILGSPTDTLDYLDGLQQGTDRYFFVSTMTAAGQSEEGASGGRPATKEGDLEIVITGYVYVLADAASVVGGGVVEGVGAGEPAN